MEPELLHEAPEGGAGGRQAALQTTRSRGDPRIHLRERLHRAGQAEQAAEETASAFARGEAGIHETIMAQERASIAVRYAVTVKNKALEAYRELMNTQI
ncbi:MAG: flagellar hook-basal body complex protein FliE [Myxococcales bacterium]|nr:flagellar hook-basal body complex protein FliE [Myxococcales bacterium]